MFGDFSNKNFLFQNQSSALQLIDNSAKAFDDLIAPSTKHEPSPAELLNQIQNERIVLQDFMPIAESLDWELGQLYWQKYGSQAFIRGEVPFIVHNDGALSEKAAKVFFASLLASEKQQTLENKIFVLEIGVGIGLFARYFLDTLKDLCLQYQKNFYDRICYLVADKSQKMLDDITAHEILSAHEDRFELCLLDALEPNLESQPHLNGVSKQSLQAVFLNYVLDSLPTTVLQFKENRISQLSLLTYLSKNVKTEDYTNLSAQDIVGLAASSKLSDKEKLVDLYYLLTTEQRYDSQIPGTVPHLDSVMKFAEKQTDSDLNEFYVLHNYGAIQSLERLLEYVHEGGFVLISDYGQLEEQVATESFHYQHFAGSTAFGLNFPLLQNHFSQSDDLIWSAPDEDNSSIYIRLLGKRSAAETVVCFKREFSKNVYEAPIKLLEAARAEVQAQRYETGLRIYGELLDQQPHNWVILGEIARLLTSSLHDYRVAAEIAKKALRLNPINPDLWNNLGDGLFYSNRPVEAHAAFLQALRLDPKNPRTFYNLIYTFARENDLETCLRMVAEGLACDQTGEYRERLLEKQNEILRRLSQRRQQKNHLLASR